VTHHVFVVRVFVVRFERVLEHGASIVYICSPNTPTGVAVHAAEIARFAEANIGVSIIVDQSFLSLSEHAEDLRVPMPANVVCVRERLEAALKEELCRC
jgi:histidinol-phosphate/aromatic aminotransferase/cobyric acid decarboxylase-like protein